jgi:hypothetical protein
MSPQLYIIKIYIPFYILFLLASLFLSLFSYRKVREETGRTWMIWFIVLRTLLFFFVFSALFSLILEIRFSRTEKPLLYILLDSSRSMEIEKNGITRKKEALLYIEKKVLPSLQRKVDTHLFLFSDRVYETVDSTEMNKGATMIGDVLKSINSSSQKQLSAIILCSDGRNTSGSDPVSIAERISLPVYTVNIGESFNENNISLSSVRVNPIVYKEDTVPVSAVLTNLGKERKKLSVKITRKGKVLDEKIVPHLDSGIDYPVQLSFVPQKPGFENLTVTVQQFDDESNKNDNRKDFSVKVLRRRKKIILLGYSLTWDYRFIRDFLLSRDDLESVCFAKISENRYTIQRKNSETKGTLQIETIDDADLVLLINPKTISSELLAKIKNRIKQNGLGLFIIGNEIPSSSEFKSIYPFIYTGNSYEGDFETYLTHIGQSSPIFTGLTTPPTKLPPISDPLRITSVKPIAEVFIEGSRENVTVPILASVNFGKGKVAAFGGVNFWHWKMLSFAAGYSPEVYDEILNNIIHWITIRKDEERLVFRIEKNRYLWGEPVTFQATLFDEMMKPFEGGIIVLHIENGDSVTGNYMMKDVGNGNYEKSITFLDPGTYTMRAKVQFPERIKTQPKISFQIEPQEVENLNTEPNHPLLEKISKISGGRVLNPDEDFPSSIEFQRVKIHSKKKVHFGMSLSVLLIIASLFLLELLFRKMKGLK